MLLLRSLHRLRFRIRQRWICRSGHLDPDPDEWGYLHGSGQVDQYCPRCQRKLFSVPLDDYEGAEAVFDAILDW